jgi:hypothetical protein
MLRAMLFPAPAMPDFEPGESVTNERFLRYDDCIQDGRLTTLAIPPALSTLWQSSIARHPGARAAYASGALSLLTRLTVTSLDAPIRVQRPIEAHVGYQLAHDRDAAGEVSRLFMNVWAGVRGRAWHRGWKPSPGQASPPREQVPAGHAFAEHTFTRPFAPPDQRRVVSLASADGPSVVPEPRYHQPAPAAAGEAPEGASWLDAVTADAVETMFTLDHSDNNQHVNSLVYVRLFLDALGRRLAATGQSPVLRSRAFDIAYRKPSFVGERVRVHIRMFAQGNLVGGAGIIAAAGEEAKPRCYVRALFGP